MQSKSKWPTVLIVLLTLAVVFGPVFVPREISRWYLASAQNAFLKNDSVLAEHFLKKAEDWDPNIKSDGDYWIAQLPRASRQNTDELLDLIERAVMTDSRWTGRARQAANKLSEDLEFAHAVRALKIASLGQRPTTADGLNQLAYMRSLAGIELDEALKDIDRAIAMEGELPSLLDTKGWVLHSMKRNLEALFYASKAIEGWEKEMAAARIPLPKPLAPSTKQESQPDDKSTADKTPDNQAKKTEVKTADKASDLTLDEPAAEHSTDQNLDLMFLDDSVDRASLSTDSLPFSLKQRQALIREARRRLGEPAFTLGVLRFHRMRILEALSQNKQLSDRASWARRAREDRQWLEERGVPAIDELF